MSNRVFRVEPNSGKFYNAESMQTARCNFGVTVTTLMNKIIVAGGDISLTETTNLVESYDYEENEWSQLGKLNEKKSSLSL